MLSILTVFGNNHHRELGGLVQTHLRDSYKRAKRGPSCLKGVMNR